MKIVYIRLVNFIGVHAAMGLHSLELSFDKIDNPIIQIYGKNRCGKTVLIQQLHPFSSINLNGDERSDLSLILSGEVGIKNIVYEVNGEVYNITHTYKPTSSGNHTISSSIEHNGEELNPSGGVTVFNNIIEKILGINKYVFQFIINGTQLTSFSNMGVTQRKNLLNKAMGIDIYAKIHKLATDDYRYVNKLIASLNNTREFLLSTYGSYENLCTMLNHKQLEYDTLQQELTQLKSTIDALTGSIMTLRQQNIQQELIDVRRTVVTYENVVKEFDTFDSNVYDTLVNEQIRINNTLGEKKSQRLVLMNERDALYKQKSDIETSLMERRKTQADYANMKATYDDIVRKIENLNIHENVESTSDYLRNMISLGQTINDMCTEIITCLSDEHLKMFGEMVINGIDISAFLIQEGSVLMDSEKEKSVMSRIRGMINTISGEQYPDCEHTDCIHWRIHDMLDTYFKSYQSTTTKFTQYDIEQFDHAYKNLQTIKRLLRVEISDEIRMIFSIETIMMNLMNHKVGIDIDRLTFLMEEAARIEMKKTYIAQINSMAYTLDKIEKLLATSVDSPDELINELDKNINEKTSMISIIDNEISELTNALSINDKRRMMVSQIQHVNIAEKKARQQQLETLQYQLEQSENQLTDYQATYSQKYNQFNIVSAELKTLVHANTQYQNTEEEINNYITDDRKFKIIAEATSSTKGKPVIAIRDKVDEALMMTNRLLNVMYDGEIELLEPTIDETSFTLPFRCGANRSNDIRYGSQSESTLLSLALSLSLASSLTPYNVPLVDEIDAYLDSYMRDNFLLMLQEIMATLKMEQMFLISHSIHPEQYEHIVYPINLSEEIERQS